MVNIRSICRGVMSDRVNAESGSRISNVGSMSAKGKVWNIPKTGPVDPQFLEAAGGDEIIAALLIRRGIDTPESAREFLDSSTYQMTSPMELPDVDKVVMRVTQAIKQKEHITVFGDYDVDGVTGTSVLLTVLKRLGASVDFYIPNRSSEGYGLNLKAVSVLASKHRTKLIITCDCGVSNFAEINLARSLGVDTLVLDHHSMPELLPPAVGIVHPKRLPEDHPLYHLPGVGVAYKACEALLLDNDLADEVDDLLDFVTLGMIADLVPLVRENRHLVRTGLPRLINSKRPGIQALLAQVKVSGDTDVVAFGLAPRINAVGRLSDATAAVELMTTGDPNVAENIARQLQLENSRRQELCDKIFLEANQMVLDKVNLDKDRAIVIYKEGWHHGVVGIVASRLVERYNRPVFIGELDATEGIVKGSARGIEAIDIYQVLKKNEHLLSKWGGHKMAAGWGTEAARADVLARAITDTCNSMLADEPLVGVLDIDAIANPATVELDLARDLIKLAPFGMGNRKPVLMMTDVTCASTRVLGKDGKHHRIMLEHATAAVPLEAVMWNTHGVVPDEGSVIDVAFTPEVNNFNNRERLQLVLADWRKAGAGVSQFQGTTSRSQSSSSQSQESINQAEAARNGEIVKGSESPGTIADPAAVAGSAAVANSDAVANSADDVSALGTETASAPRAIKSQVSTWKDLRNFKDSDDVLRKASEKFGDDLAIFAETIPPVTGFKFRDRTGVGPASNLLILETPPTLSLMRELIVKSCARNVFLVGRENAHFDDAGAFLKQLLGLVKYAVNKKDGQVEAEKLSAAMGTSKMAIALGLGILRKLHVVDWYAEDGVLFLDLIGNPEGQPEEHLEYRQLKESLDGIKRFRAWCADSSFKEIQLAVSPNQVGLTDSKSDRFASAVMGEADEVDVTDERDQSPDERTPIKG